MPLKSLEKRLQLLEPERSEKNTLMTWEEFSYHYNLGKHIARIWPDPDTVPRFILGGFREPPEKNPGSENESSDD